MPKPEILPISQAWEAYPLSTRLVGRVGGVKQGPWVHRTEQSQRKDPKRTELASPHDCEQKDNQASDHEPSCIPVHEVKDCGPRPNRYKTTAKVKRRKKRGFFSPSGFLAVSTSAAVVQCYPLQCQPLQCQLPQCHPLQCQPPQCDLSNANLGSADLTVPTSAMPTSAMPTSAVPLSAVPTSGCRPQRCHCGMDELWRCRSQCGEEP